MLLFLAGALVGLLVLEAALHALGYFTPLVWEPDPVLGWRHVKNARRHFVVEGDGLIVINSDGHRDRERSLAAPEGTFRIAVFGDSMTEGMQVQPDETYTSVLESRYQSENRPIEVLNFAVNAYGTIQELLSFRQQVGRYNPDLLVLATFLDNDVHDCDPALSRADAPFFRSLADPPRAFDFSRAEISFRDYQIQPFHFLRRHSALYGILGAWRAGRRNAHNVPADDNAIPHRFQMYLRNPPKKWEHAWQLYEKALLELQASARDAGVPLVILSIPAAHVVRPAAWQRMLDVHPVLTHGEWDLDGPEHRLRRLADEHGFELLQPLETLRAAPGLPPLHFRESGRMTPEGHTRMADYLYENLASVPR
jgi:hypothetical protein